MSLPRSVADVLQQHVTLEVEGIDRMYLNVYQPRLQTDRGVAAFFRFHRGATFASSALMDPMSKAFVAAVERFVEQEQIPLVTFAKGQRKDDVAQEYRSALRRDRGDRLSSARRRRRHPSSAPRSAAIPKPARPTPGSCGPRPWSTTTTSTGIDEDFGPFFLKFCTYFPYNAKLCINGHEYVKRQLAKEGIAFEALDNGVLELRRSHAAAATLRRTLGRKDRRAAPQVAGAPRRTPSPPRIAAAGYRYDVSILQAEFSLTQVLDRPFTGRVFFEEVIRENLDLGRPDQVQLIFDRRITKQHAGPVPHARDHRGGHPVAAHRLQAFPDQAVSQGRPRPADRDHDQRSPATSASASGCPICPPCGGSAFKPIDVSWTSNGSATTARWAKTRSTGSMSRSRSTGNGPAVCASPTWPCRPCSLRCWCFVSCLGVFPTATCATIGLPAGERP